MVLEVKGYRERSRSVSRGQDVWTCDMEFGCTAVKHLIDVSRGQVVPRYAVLPYNNNCHTLIIEYLVVIGRLRQELGRKAYNTIDTIIAMNPSKVTIQGQLKPRKIRKKCLRVTFSYFFCIFEPNFRGLVGLELRH